MVETRGNADCESTGRLGTEVMHWSAHHPQGSVICASAEHACWVRILRCLSEPQGGDSCLPPTAEAQSSTILCHVVLEPYPPEGCFPKKAVPVLVEREGAVKIWVSGLSMVKGRPWTGQPWPLWAGLGGSGFCCLAPGMAFLSSTWTRSSGRAGPGRCLHAPHCESGACALGSRRGTGSCAATGARGFQGASWLPAVCSAHPRGQALTCACAKTCPLKSTPHSVHVILVC